MEIEKKIRNKIPSKQFGAIQKKGNRTGLSL